jgi:hypothetical protein
MTVRPSGDTALGEPHEKPAVGDPRRDVDLADRPELAPRGDLLRRSTGSGDDQHLAPPVGNAALEGDPLAVRRPVGVVVHDPGRGLGELPLIGPIGVDGEDRAVRPGVVQVPPERDPARQLDVRGCCCPGRRARVCGRPARAATPGGEGGDRERGDGDEGTRERSPHVGFRGTAGMTVRALRENVEFETAGSGVRRHGDLRGVR